MYKHMHIHVCVVYQKKRRTDASKDLEAIRISLLELYSSCYYSQFYLDFTLILKNPIKYTFLENIIWKDPIEAPAVLANEL